MFGLKDQQIDGPIEGNARNTTYRTSQSTRPQNQALANPTGNDKLKSYGGASGFYNPSLNNRNIFRLDDNCLSCSGQSAIIHNAFKFACLAYNPSNISVDGNYSRQGACGRA